MWSLRPAARSPSSSSSSLLLFLLLVVSLPLLTLGDLYMHNPHGSTNRLNENTRPRANDNRVFDSQDNNRGGYPVPTNGRMYYYSGSILYIEWTAQHACGANPTDSCQFILQYACDNTNTMRDGTSTNTIPDPANNGNAQCANANCDTDPTYGRHEGQAYYNSSKRTFRNAGLWTADQQLNGQSRQYTRQNNGGAQYGYECTEERDYYPWWGASPWKDIAILTNAPSRCPAYQAESQNVKPRYTCVITTPTAAQQQQAANNQPYIPITQVGCTAAGGVWTVVPAWNIPAPDCQGNVQDGPSRDNHLGNPMGYDGFTYSYNWTLPNDYSETCVLRMRYNISTADFNVSGVHSADPSDAGFASATSIQAGLDYTFNAVNPGTGTATTLPVYLSAGFPDGSQNPFVTTANQFTRGYVFENNPNADPFGPLVWSDAERNAFSPPPGSGLPGGVLPAYFSKVGQKLAINTAQFSRTFQDRSFLFAIRQRPAALVGANIFNVNVRGKRGNIVQVYPSVEYDFIPDRLTLTVGDLVHFQWAGADTNPTNNDPQGANNPAGSDRSNVIVMGPRVWNELGQQSNATTTGQWGRALPCRIDDDVVCPFLGLGIMDLQRLALNGLNSSYFDLGPRQVTRSGTYHYMSTRNNNFSNRSHKARLVVLERNATQGAEYDVVAWGLQCGSETASTANTGGASLDAGQCSGQLVTSQDVYIQSGGSSGYDSDWFQLLPLQLTLAAPLTVTLPYRYLLLNDPQVYWKPNATALTLTRVGGEVREGSTVQFSAQSGGYFVVQNAVNGGDVAGIVLAGCVILAVVGFLYWKVRVEPEGGVEAWMRACCGKKGYDQHQDDAQVTRQLMTATPRAV